MHLIVIGGVAAGAKAAARARRVNRDIAITLYQEESEVSYTACGQPYYLSGLVASRDALIIRRASEFKADEIEVRLRHRVINVSTAECTVKVHDLDRDAVEVVPYDRLILATGARPVIPVVPGSHLDGVVTLRTMAELDGFRSALDRLRPKGAVIVGGGYIGLEVAESLHALGVEATIVERFERLFPRLDPEMSQRVHDYLIAQGVRVVVDDGMAEITEKAGRV
ncbi:MAG: NAD(P)/FAD-dependent oxidoreductase, partial [bacterium]